MCLSARIVETRRHAKWDIFLSKHKKELGQVVSVTLSKDSVNAVQNINVKFLGMKQLEPYRSVRVVNNGQSARTCARSYVDVAIVCVVLEVHV